jgi:hypothetical protein
MEVDSGALSTRQAVVLDLWRAVGQVSWLLFSACKHHLLAERPPTSRADLIVAQLDDLTSVLLDKQQQNNPHAHASPAPAAASRAQDADVEFATDFYVVL